MTVNIIQTIMYHQVPKYRAAIRTAGENITDRKISQLAQNYRLNIFKLTKYSLAYQEAKKSVDFREKHYDVKIAQIARDHFITDEELMLLLE